MKLTLVNLYPTETMARYLLSSYVLKAYLNRFFGGGGSLSVDILNFSINTQTSEICKEIVKGKPDCVGFSCYVWNIEEALNIVNTLKKRSDSIHILGGPEISLGRILSLPDPSLADYYVIADGERKLLNLVSFLEAKGKGLDVELPKGVACWNNNKLNYVEDTDKITNLDEIPSVYLSGVLEDRLYARQQAFLETQRGCRFKCKYCVYHKSLPSISYYSLPRILDELDHLIIKKQIMALRIFDAIFSSDLNRAKEIVKHLLELKTRKGVRLPWIYWEFRYDSVDEEFIKLTALLKYRYRILNTNDIPPLDRPQLYSDMLNDYTVISSVGIESCYKQALNAVGRPGIDIKEFDTFMNMVREYNIVLKMDLILGLPLETFDSYFQGLEFLLPYFKDTDHVLNIHRLQIIPGCALENLCDKYEIEYSREAPHLVTSTKSFPEEELEHASKLSAILFRIVNSPLRRQFFDAKEQAGKSFYGLIEDIFKRVAEEFPKTRLVQDERVDDIYWNGDIFSEIPSSWLTALLEKHYLTKGALNA
jgi:radical SAM superfamily enzyme YgiQ (UPF0313 family)